MIMDKKIITYRDSYGIEYKTRPIPSTDIKRKIQSIQDTNDGKATIVSIE